MWRAQRPREKRKRIGERERKKKEKKKENEYKKKKKKKKVESSSSATHQPTLSRKKKRKKEKIKYQDHTRLSFIFVTISRRRFVGSFVFFFSRWWERETGRYSRTNAKPPKATRSSQAVWLFTRESKRIYPHAHAHSRGPTSPTKIK
jgi:hypothetical protein